LASELPYTLPANTVTYAPFQYFNGRDGFSFAANDVPTERPYQISNMVVTVIPVNDAPVITVGQNEYTVSTGGADHASTSLGNITVSDVDVGGNLMTATVTLTGPGVIAAYVSVSSDKVIVQNSTYIQFLATVDVVQRIFNTLSYTVQTADLGSGDNTAYIELNVNDNGNTGKVFNPLSANQTVAIKTSNVGSSVSNAVLIGGVVGGAAAAGAGVAGAYFLLKKNDVFDTNPFDNLDMVDVAMDNPLHQVKGDNMNPLYSNKA